MGFDFGFKTEKRRKIEPENSKNPESTDKSTNPETNNPETNNPDTNNLDTSTPTLKKVPYNPSNPALPIPQYAIYASGNSEVPKKHGQSAKMDFISLLNPELPILGIKDENEDETDIVTGKYEGGMVIWECSIDLIEKLPKLVRPDIKRVLELGCGQGLPAVSLSQKFDLEVLTMQDYNEYVLEEVTTAVLKHASFGADVEKSEVGVSADANSGDQKSDESDCKKLVPPSGDIDLKLGGSLSSSVEPKPSKKRKLEPESESTLETQITSKKPDTPKISLFSGDWMDLKNTSELLNLKHDCVIVSECTYNKQYYDRLHSALEALLTENKDLEIFCAMKEYYFGVGGSVLDWEEFVREKAVFDMVVVEKFEDTLNRFILKMTKRMTKKVITDENDEN